MKSYHPYMLRPPDILRKTGSTIQQRFPPEENEKSKKKTEKMKKKSKHKSKNTEQIEMTDLSSKSNGAEFVNGSDSDVCNKQNRKRKRRTCCRGCRKCHNCCVVSWNYHYFMFILYLLTTVCKNEWPTVCNSYLLNNLCQRHVVTVWKPGDAIIVGKSYCGQQRKKK